LKKCPKSIAFHLSLQQDNLKGGSEVLKSAKKAKFRFTPFSLMPIEDVRNNANFLLISKAPALCDREKNDFLNHNVCLIYENDAMNIIKL
jgi:hypothetical protein